MGKRRAPPLDQGQPGAQKRRGAVKKDSLPPPKAIRPDKDKLGGYDCEFVEAPPTWLQTECSVCLLILKEPCLINCCGHKFCLVCIERVEKAKKPCPLCTAPHFSFMRELGLERSLLNNFEVFCSYRKDGCTWNGLLGELAAHFNRDSTPENQPNECQFAEVECGNKCGEWFHRCEVTIHETWYCKKRPYSCDHCRDYHSTFEDVTETHHPQCSKYPVVCPNACRECPFERQELKSHLQDHCLLALIDCPFNYAGCKTQLLRKDMPKHMEETVTHLTLLAPFTQKLVKENQELQQSSAEKDQKLCVTKEEVETLKNSTILLPCQFLVKFSSDTRSSPAFYTQPRGYRMCLDVYPNRVGNVKGTHVSMYTHLMKGQFDEHLKWPFRGVVTIQIVNQAGDHDHVERTFAYTDQTPNDYAGRVTDKERSEGWGHHTFLALTALHYNTTKKTHYLRDNHFVVRVVKVKVT